MKNILKENYIRLSFLFIIVLSLISMCRSLLVPLVNDEITYFKIASNILKGKYYYTDYPSTVTPVISFVTAFFNSFLSQPYSLVFHKIFNILLYGFGLKYLYLLLKSQKLDHTIALLIVVLTVVNPISVSWFSTMYPEAILFFSFWGFMYCMTKEFSENTIIKLLFFFTVMCLTRYVYSVIGLVLLIRFYNDLKDNFNSRIWIITKYSIFFLIPVVIWIKYMMNVETNQLSGISYFNRFKTENSLLYNIKCGLGLEKHYLVDKVNGLPAFVSLFVPITGIRSFLISSVLFVVFLIGFIKKGNTKALKIVLLSCILVMLGFVFAGTGFSRYWLVLLPIYFLGFYYFSKLIGINDKWFILISQCISVIYIINEFRVDYLVISKLYE